MKKILIVLAGLLVSAAGIGQTTTYYATSPGAAGTGGLNDVHIGNNAGLNMTTGKQNVFVGVDAGQASNLENNTFIGYKAGQSTVTEGNVFVGSFSGESVFGSTLKNNSFLGHNSGRYSLGSSNCFFGNGSGMYAGLGSNICIGGEAGRGNSTIHLGSGNIAIGHMAAELNTGSSSVMLGVKAGHVATGSNNVFVGHESGLNTNGWSNVFLGYKAGRNETGSNKLYIANSDTANPLIYGEFTNKVLKLNARVGIGTDFTDFPSLTSTTLPLSTYKLFVKGGILAEEVRIRTITTWPDYVFDNNYKLKTLEEVEEFINENGHLPNVPSAKEVEEEGLELSNIVKVQQEKIEELTLYLIKQNKQIEELQMQVKQLLNKED